MSQPLRGSLVIEAVTTDCPHALRLAVACAGRLASDLGAEVIQLHTNPETPLPAFLTLGKHAVTNDADQALWRRALVVIGNDATFLAEIPPLAVIPPIRVVLSMLHASVSTPIPASEFTVMAMSGLLDLVGDAERQPLKLGGHQLAYSAGLSAFTGMMAALARRTAAMPSETVRVNLLDTALWLNWKSVVTASHHVAVPSRASRNAEWRIVPCADGWIALVFRDVDWKKLKALIADTRLDAVHFDTHAGRREHAGELAHIMETAFRTWRRADLHQRALQDRIPLGPVYSPEELIHDPQNIARHFFQLHDVAGLGRVYIPRLPVLWNSAELSKAEHTRLEGERWECAA